MASPTSAGASEEVVRPAGRVTGLLVVATSAAAILATGAAWALADHLPSLLAVLPVLLTLTATTGVLAALFLRAQARSTDDQRLGLIATALAVTAAAMWVQLLGFPAVSPTGGPLGTTSSGAASLYYTWHLVVPALALLACSPLARVRWVRRAATAVASLLVVWSAVGVLPDPVWIGEDGRYTTPAVAITWVATVLALAAVVVWVRAIGRRPLWTEAWVTAVLLFVGLDALLHGLGVERFTPWWWASLAMRVCSVVVPALGLAIGSVRLFRALDSHADALGAAHADLARANAELARSNEELGAVAEVMAHDLRNPLAAARGMVETVLLLGGLDERHEQLLQRALSAQVRQTDLITDLLRLASARSDALETRDLSPTRLLEDVVGASPELLGAVTVGVVPDVHADPGALRQVLQNLLANAVAYVDGDTAPRVVVQGRRLDDGRVAIDVVDNGVGVAPADRERIFAPHERAGDRTVRGTGLGLAVCRRLLERQDGTVTVHDGPWGVGSRFQVVLPAATAPPAPVRAPADPARGAVRLRVG